MMKLKTIKFAGELRQFTELAGAMRNKTRWTSTMKMIERYFELRPFLPSFYRLTDLTPNAKETKELMDLREKAKILYSVTNALQREDQDLSDVRNLFDAVLGKFEGVEFRDYSQPHSPIVQKLEFESGLRKILSKKFSEISNEEQNSLLPIETNGVSTTRRRSSEDDDFATSYLKRRRLEKAKEKMSKYIFPNFISPTSDVLERVFSSAGYAYNDYRKNLLPINLEMQLFKK